MADTRVETAHALGKEAAVRVAQRMKEKAQLEFRVIGDVIDDRAIAEVTLGSMLKPVRSLVEGKLEDYFT